VRSELCLKFFESAFSNGYEVISVDRNSPEYFLRELRRFSRVFPQHSETMGSGRREAISHALETGKEILLWSEPEKYPLIPFIPEIAEPILNQRTNLVMPNRRSLASYPYMQQLSESFGNSFWKRLTGTDIDIFFGPKAWRRNRSGYFLDYKGEYEDKWDSVIIPVMDYLFYEGVPETVSIDYSHPAEQTENESCSLEMDKKRIHQLHKFVEYAEKHWKTLKKTLISE
jgi:hypothetical protein